MATLHGLTAERFARVFHAYGYQTQRIAAKDDVVVLKCSRRDPASASVFEFAAALVGRNAENTFDTAFLRAHFRTDPDAASLNAFNKSALLARASQGAERDAVINMDFLALGLSDAALSAHVELWFLNIGQYLRTATGRIPG